MGTDLTARYKEHCRFIKTNTPRSAYALLVLNNGHEYGLLHDTVELINPGEKGKKLYRVIHKSLRNFRTRLRNNQERQGRKEHINR